MILMPTARYSTSSGGWQMDDDGPLFDFIRHLSDEVASRPVGDTATDSAERQAARDEMLKPLTPEERGALLCELDDLLLCRRYGYADAGTEARLRYIMRRLR